MSGHRKTAPEPLPAPLPAVNEAVATTRYAEEQPRILTPRTGWVLGVEQGRLLVDYPGNLRGPLPARCTVPLDAKAALAAAASRQGALLVFEDGDPQQPILIGLHQPPVATLIDLVLEGTGDETASLEEAAPVFDRAEGAPIAASADGKRLLVEGEEEVTLRCGAASISLRRDGRVVVRGAYVETHASGTNRIKGGSVRIN